MSYPVVIYCKGGAAMLMRGVSLVFLLFLGVGLGGCSTQTLRADVDPNSNLSDKHTFYVQRLSTDTRGVEKLIASELSRRGKAASYGDASTPDQPVDAIVTYVDKWMWDITMYMLELRVEVREPQTGYILATGQSYRTSLVRKDPEGMVGEVIGEIMREAK